MLSHELLLSTEEYICATRHRTDLWNVRGTWRWCLRWSLHQPNVPSFRGAQLSLIMCHKLLIKGSRVKKHHMGKAFPRKDSEKQSFASACRFISLYVSKVWWPHLQYIYIYIEKRNTVYLYLWEGRLLPFCLFLTYVYSIPENMLDLKKKKKPEFDSWQTMWVWTSSKGLKTAEDGMNYNSYFVKEKLIGEQISPKVVLTFFSFSKRYQ